MYLTSPMKAEILSLIDRSSLIAKVSSFHAKAQELVAEIQYHQRVTEWLEAEFVPMLADLPRLAGLRMYLINHRGKLVDHLQNTILGIDA